MADPFVNRRGRAYLPGDLNVTVCTVRMPSSGSTTSISTFCSWRGRLTRMIAQAKAGDIVLFFAGESKALTHPYLARARAKRGADLRVPVPGQAKKVAMAGVRSQRPQAHRAHEQNQAQQRITQAPEFSSVPGLFARLGSLPDETG
jgi:hypothetical protein